MQATTLAAVVFSSGQIMMTMAVAAAAELAACPEGKL